MDRSEIARIASELEQVLADHPSRASFLKEFHAAVTGNDMAAAVQMYSSLEM
jgi:hypothetical protein